MALQAPSGYLRVQLDAVGVQNQCALAANNPSTGACPAVFASSVNV